MILSRGMILILSMFPSLLVGQTQFGMPQDIHGPSSDGCESVFAADLDGDGDPDIISASFYDSRVAWHENRLNEASVDFGPQQTITTNAGNAREAIAADLDGDGDFDVLSVSTADDRIAWYENRLNEGSADFGSQTTISTAVDGPLSIAVSDLDGDGDLDALSATTNFGRIAWFENRLNEVSADFSGPSDIYAGADAAGWAVHAADLDGDGDADVLSASWLDGNVAWFENMLDEPGGSFGSPQAISSDGGNAIEVYSADLDGDGDEDILANASTSGGIAWFENRLNEASADISSERVIATLGFAAGSVYTIDMDRDGDMDVLTASATDDRIAWYENRLNDPAADFAPRQTISDTANFAQYVYAADLDGDGDIDVLSASFEDGRITWYENVTPKTREGYFLY